MGELWREGDGIWVTVGEYRGHAGTVGRDQVEGDETVLVNIRAGTDKRPGDVFGPVPVEWLQSYRWIPPAEQERLANLIAGLYPKGKRATVRAWELADFLMMHGLVFAPAEKPGLPVLTWHPATADPAEPIEVPLNTHIDWCPEELGEFRVSTREVPPADAAPEVSGA